MPTSISRQTRTPPALKWLLNERAAVAGQVQAASIRCQLWAAKIDKIRLQLVACSANHQSVLTVQAAQQATLDALDVAIGLACESVRPDAAGTVSAWAGKYGKRGALTEFVAATLLAALPAGVDVSTLVNLASKHFHISVLHAQDRKSLRLSVKSAVLILARDGRTVPIHQRTKTGAPGVWRWKQPATLSDLMAKATSMREQALEGEPGNYAGHLGSQPSAGAEDPDTARPEVAAQ